MTEKKDNALLYKKKHIWTDIASRPAEMDKIMKFSEDYKKFLSDAKTEREAVKYVLSLLGKSWKPLDKAKTLKPGDKFYSLNRGKNIALIVVGKTPIEEGINLIGAHVDAPRLDLKQNPVYEDGDTHIGLLRTHYYGGIKKYQWASIPLALHGVVILADGSSVDVVIGEDEDDPVFTIPDLLPHLSAHKQNTRKATDTLKGEELLVIMGSIPVTNTKIKDKVKLNLLKKLNKDYGITEEDLISAELEIVPAGQARDVGLDRSMIGAYGQDDRICSFTSVQAITNIKGTPKRTTMVLLFDKEEIGSEGNTSAKSRYLEGILGDLLMLQLGDKYNDQHLRRCLTGTMGISADVNGAINPIFKDVHEKQNAAKIGYGICITKFTGSRGKALSNDASAEFVGKIRRILNSAKVPWQTGELGKVDEGGGGTVAKFMAQLNMDVIDAGPAIIAMHSPFEISSKADVYYTFKAYKAFLES